nr:zinc finger protein 420 [Ciona intestinalis]XP_018668474.1 zinc finger protein 420 [Ciona intestinalis]|eukprot:XP_009859292.1 zinc finger protein 420 [Ciona intestinalis]
MMESTKYWLPSSSEGTHNIPIEVNNSKPKDSDITVISQTSMVNFANIFAGATAAVASSGAAESGSMNGNNAKNFMVGQGVPSLNQISIPSANQLSKRGTVFSGTLPGMGTINNIGMVNSNVIISTTTPQIDNNIQCGSSVQSMYTSSAPMSITIRKDFIEQAAAESGVTMIQHSIPTIMTPIYATQQQQQQQQGERSMTRSVMSVPINQVQASISTEIEGEMTHKCNECNEVFGSAGKLSFHNFKCHAELHARPYKCSACPESFLAPHHLQDHMKAVHLHNENQNSSVVFTCSDCQACFMNGGQLNYHIYMAHTVQGPRAIHHKCLECGKNFMKSSLLSSHMRNVHGVNAMAVQSNTSVSVPTTVQNTDAAKPFACVECDKSFKTNPYLKQHVLAVHNKPNKCEQCGKGFGRRSDLNRHLRSVHMRERNHSCSKCGWTFAEAGNLKHHIQAVHTKEKNFQCLICSKQFSISSYLKTHMIRVHGVDESTKNAVQTALAIQNHNHFNLQQPTSTVVVPVAQVNRCFECGQMFENAAMLQHHVMSTHPQPFWCTVCGEGFSQASQLQSHLQVRHSDNNNNQQPTNPITAVIQSTNQSQGVSSNRPMGLVGQQIDLNQLPDNLNKSCLECGAVIDKTIKRHVCHGVKFQQQTALPGVAAVALATERPHLCTKCGKGFKTATHLKQHVRCVHTNDRPHKCTQCSKTFARMSDLNRHRRGVHERDKGTSKSLRMLSLKCTQCGATFPETIQLKRHVLTVHMNQLPCYKCADCQEGFADESQFKSHICYEEERPHVCHICSKRFSAPTQLRRHVRSAHNPGNPQTTHQLHKCFECSRSFTRPVDLERHIHAVHLKEKPHKCHVCGKHFGLHGNLNKHIRAVHMLEKPHQCVECGKCFAHIGVLKRHLRDIHFYDKRPGSKKNTAAIINIQQTQEHEDQQQTEQVSHLSVLQAIEAMQQQEQQQQQQQQLVHSQQQQHVHNVTNDLNMTSSPQLIQENMTNHKQN